MLPDVVFCIGPNVGRAEFQYALRSIELVPHSKVWIVGHKPDWVRNVGHIPFNVPNKWQALHDVWPFLARCDDIADEFVYSEDDYFIIQPVEDLPNYWQEPLAAKVARADQERRNGGWSNSLRDTLAVLRANGIADPLSFDVHIPMVVKRSEIPLHMDDQRAPLRWRSLYGNVASRPPVRLSLDVKHTTPEELANGLQKTPGFLSSNEQTFTSSGVEAVLQRRLPYPSKYER